MRDSWDLGGSGISANTACGQKTALPLRDYINPFAFTGLYLPYFFDRSPSRDYINPFTFTGLYPSVRLHGTISDHFFFGPGLERNLTTWTRFSVRVIAHERHLSLSFYLPPSDGLLLTIWTGFSVRVIAHERHLSLSFLSTAERRLTADHFGPDFLYA